MTASCEWLPIESAPKDGSEFDVWYQAHDACFPMPAHRVTNVYWSDVQDGFCTDGQFGREEPSPLPLYPRPTHWMPHPEPPQSKSAGADTGARSISGATHSDGGAL